MNGCELAFLGGCSGRLNSHHIINKSRTRGNKAARKFIDAHPEIFFARVCAHHNQSRWADTKRCRRILVLHKTASQGLDAVDYHLAELRKLFKSNADDLTIRGLTG